MKRFIVFIALALLAGRPQVLAQSQDDQYVRVYNTIQEGDSFYERGLFSQAMPKYVDALAALEKFQKGYPEWNSDVVKFRLSYLSKRVAELSAKAAATASPSPATSTPPPPTPTPATPTASSPAPTPATPSAPADWEAQLAGAKTQVQQLQSENTRLEAKLKEALAARPAAIDPGELAKAEEKIRALQKENELLNISLREKTTAATAAAPANPSKSDETVAQLNRQLTEQKDMVARLSLEKEALQNRLKALPAGGSQDTSAVATLRARLEALEAQAVPYTTEELALFDPTRVRTSPVTSAKKPSGKLSKASAAELADAQRFASAGQFDKAEERYLKVLKDEDQNVPLLANLAEIQIQLAKLDDAEKNITKALKLSPDDAQSLSTLGNLKSHQRKVDEAVDALSRAAKLEPNNPEILNRLGIALSQKGLRGPAETALRKAILLQPNFADAHKNLAVVYLSQDPPLTELAQWHYQKALASGAPSNPDLEKLLQSKKAAGEKK